MSLGMSLWGTSVCVGVCAWVHVYAYSVYLCMRHMYMYNYSKITQFKVQMSVSLWLATSTYVSTSITHTTHSWGKHLHSYAWFPTASPSGGGCTVEAVGNLGVVGSPNSSRKFTSYEYIVIISDHFPWIATVMNGVQIITAKARRRFSLGW